MTIKLGILLVLGSVMALWFILGFVAGIPFGLVEVVTVFFGLLIGLVLGNVMALWFIEVTRHDDR